MTEQQLPAVGKRMCIGMVLLAAATPLFAQINANTGHAAPPACGPDSKQFVVKTDFEDHPLEKAEGKAVVYFLQDDGQIPRPTVRWGVDGTWAGATHSQSYFHIVVNPGEHHLCTSWQWTVPFGPGRQLALFHFTAEPGKTYYFRARTYHSSGLPEPQTELAAADSDEGRFLTGRYAYSSSRPKK